MSVDAYQRAPAGLVSFRDDGRVVAVNDTLLALSGWSRDELVDVASIFAAASRSLFASDVLPALALGAPVDAIELTLRTRDGEDVPVLLTARRAGDVNDAVIVVVRQRHRHEEELRLAGLLAAGLGHDYNNLLATILGNAELVADELGPRHPAREALADVAEASRRAAALTEKVLAHAGRAKSVTPPAEHGLSSVVPIVVARPCASVPPPGARPVLVVDDDEQVRHLTLRLLSKVGLPTMSAQSGEEALALLESGVDVACIVLDLTMAGLGGDEVLRRLRASGSRVPVIIASGHTEEEILERVTMDAITCVLPKPYTLSDLRAVLARVGIEGAPPAARSPAATSNVLALPKKT